MSKIKRLYIFDFDKTLCFTPTQEVGQSIWEKHTGLSWYSVNKGWWGAAESLNMDIFHIPLNKYVHNMYLKSKEDKDSHVYLVTGRLKRLESKVKKICDYHNLEFEEVFCNTGGNTLSFKLNIFESLISKYPSLEEVYIYDDRIEHLYKFAEWANEQDLSIKVLDVINKKMMT